MLIRVPELDDATIMHRLNLHGARELELFKLIWQSGGDGVSEFPVIEIRKRIYQIRRRFREKGMSIDIVSLGDGKYAFTRASHERIAALLNASPVNY